MSAHDHGTGHPRHALQRVQSCYRTNGTKYGMRIGSQENQGQFVESWVYVYRVSYMCSLPIAVRDTDLTFALG